MRIFRSVRFLFQLLVLLATLSACNTTKFLTEDELLLQKNSIKFINTKKVKNKTALSYELASLYQQTPNTNFLLFFPREWFYFNTQAPEDTSTFDRWQRRVLSEQPAIHDPTLADSTATSMRYLLQYNGYYDAEVFFDDVVKNKKVKVTYFVDTKQLYAIDSVFFSSEDTTVHRILQETQAQTLLKPGEALTRTLYEQERERITNSLRNRGYADFYSNYVSPLVADTTYHTGKANVYMDVLPPMQDSLHKRYRVGSVYVYSQYDPTADDITLRDTIVKGFHFRFPKESSFKVRPQILSESIHLRTGDLYNQANYDLTIRQLSSLGVYRFVRIKEQADSLDAGVLHFRIELTRNLRMEMGIDFELNYTNRSVTAGAGNLIGITASPSLRNRNLFRGAELLATNISAGVEVNPTATDSTFWNTIDLRVQTNLYFPKFYDYLGLWRGLYSARISKKGGIISDDFYRALHEGAQTRLSASYNYLLLLGFYRYNLLNASYGFDLQESTPSGTRRYLIGHVGIDYLQPTTQKAFDDILNSNPFLARSFGDQLFVSLLFRDFNYVFNSRPNRRGQSHYWGFNFETAGTEIWAGNAIYNAFALSSDTLRIGNIDFSQYVKTEVDYRYYKQYTPKTSLAMRFNFGIARPFGFTTDVPYVKQFYVGGPNSIRAWAIRGVGPGGYEDPLTVDPNPSNRLLFYQTGDLKLEFNLEYRFNIFWRFNGAFFLDGGNVWTLRQDPDRPGSQFLFQPRAIDNSKLPYPVNDAFHRQIALGSGVGARLDMTYFIFRLDLGLRLRSPFPLTENFSDGSPVTERDYWYDWNKYNFWDLVNFNIGLGYPF